MAKLFGGLQAHRPQLGQAIKVFLVLFVHKKNNPSRASPGRQEGYALLLVLIAVGLVAILLGQMESGAGAAARLAAGLRDQAEAQQAADGAVWHEIYYDLPGQPASWPVDASARRIAIGGITAQARAEDLAGRVDLNQNSAAAVAVILRGIGVDGSMAQALGAKLIDWRTGSTQKQDTGAKQPEYLAAHLPYGPPNGLYENLGEIELVLGMTPAIAGALQDKLTIYSFGQPRLGAARSALELDALKTALENQPQPPSNPPSVLFYAISARAEAGSATAVRHAVVRVDMNQANQGRFWRLMDWR